MTHSTSALRFEKEKRSLRRSLQKKLKRQQKGILEKEKALTCAYNWQKEEHCGDLLKANFSKLKPKMSSITVVDFLDENRPVTIPLDPELEPKEQLKAYYQKSKKQKKSIPHLELAIEHLKKEKESLEACLKALALCDTDESLLLFQKSHYQKRKNTPPQKHKEKVSAYHTFYSVTCHFIFVGKNAESNDQLTFQKAKGDDLWLHAHHVAGSHVVIRKKPPAQIDEETLLDAAHLALYFSKARHLTGNQEVVVTERKYVSRIKGAPKGKVTLSKHKLLKVTLDLDRITSIKARKAANEKQ